MLKQNNIDFISEDPEIVIQQIKKEIKQHQNVIKDLNQIVSKIKEILNDQ